MAHSRSHHGLFIGLTTLDLIYLADHPPEANQKIVASDYTVSAGGPATNAAVTFSYLGNHATLVSVIGLHPLAHLIRSDLQQYGVTCQDLAPTRPDPPPVSSIVVTAATGDRAVISLNAINRQVIAADNPIQDLQGVEIVLIDGHQIEVGRAIAQQAKAQGIPVVMDGGSWKPGLDILLPFVDYAICSANFYPPDCHTQETVLIYLAQWDIPHIAITQGARPIYYRMGEADGWVSVPSVKAVDTLGAGDILHGAFCHAILQTGFVEALQMAAQVASHACQFFGTRRWMNHALIS